MDGCPISDCPWIAALKRYASKFKLGMVLPVVSSTCNFFKIALFASSYDTSL